MGTPTAIVFELGEEATSGTITQWFVAEGGEVRSGQRLLEIETDKATIEMAAPADGLLLKVAKAVGAEILRGDPLGWIGDAGSDPASVEQEVRLRVDAACPVCRSSVAINGPWLEATCARCGFQAPLDATFWDEAFAVAARGEGTTRIRCGPWRVFVLAQRGAPSCHNCDAELLVRSQTPMHTVICGRCGLPHPAAPPPAWLRTHDPTIVRVVGDGPMAAAPRPTACGHCQASVHPENRACVPRCAQCGRDVVVPSSPPPLARSWVVLRAPLKT